MSERPLECSACATVTPHVRQPLRPGFRPTSAVALAAGVAGLVWGAAALLAVAGGGTAWWAVRKLGGERPRVCVRCAGLRVRSERPFRNGDELSVW